MSFRVKQKLGTVRIINKFGDWGVRWFDDHLTLRPTTSKTAFTLVVYLKDKDLREIENEINKFLQMETLYIRRATFGIRKNKLEYALVGEILANPDPEKYNYTLVVEKGKIQMKRPISLKYFENEGIRLYLIEKEKEKDIEISGTPKVIKADRGEIYIFGDFQIGNSQVEWLDEFQTVGVCKEEEENG